MTDESTQAPTERPAEDHGRVVAVVAAKDEMTRISATVAALQGLEQVGWVVVVDDGSADSTADLAQWAGAEVVRHQKNRGKGEAMTTGAARAAKLAPDAPVLFADADLGESASSLGALIAPVLSGAVDMTIAVLPPQDRAGGLGLVVNTAREGIKRATGWTPEQPLSGQRCLSRSALESAMPLAHGWGVEVGLTIDVLRAGGRVMEIPCPLQHRATGNDLQSQLHRAKQLADVGRVLADRSGAPEAAKNKTLEVTEQVRGGAIRLADQAREKAPPLIARAREHSAPYVDKAKERGAPLIAKAKEKGGPWWARAKGEAQRVWEESTPPSQRSPERAEHPEDPRQDLEAEPGQEAQPPQD